MQAEIDIEMHGEIHEQVKEYAYAQDVRMSDAFAELIEKGLDSTSDGTQR